MLIIFKKGKFGKCFDSLSKKRKKKANLGSFLLAETKMMSIFAIPIL